MAKIDQMRKGTTDMMILKLLADAGVPLHGYEIIQRLDSSSCGLFEFKDGLIYPRLHQMARDGLLISRWIDAPNGRRRKVYSLTERGRRQLAADMAHWQDFSQVVNRLLGLEESAA
ncbi:MAG: PadR family transcriptional regulator [Chloroflexi bacterium]|nr:PadR family transcriptional regulator [Chloroflexota bacterium]